MDQQSCRRLGASGRRGRSEGGPGAVVDRPCGGPGAAQSAALVAALLLALGTTGCGKKESLPTPAAPAEVRAAPSEVPPSEVPPSEVPKESPDLPEEKILLVDRAAEYGLTFLHRSGQKGTFNYPEIMCGGVCLADLNGDGALDVYLAQGGPVPGDPGDPGRNALFLNDGTGRFSDASAASGADDPGYGMGAFAADVDGDGDQDLLLTNTGSLVLLQNQGEATFEDISPQAELENREGFWLNAAFCDLNQDGNLDIYVSNYTLWRPGVDPKCFAPGGSPDYCNPVSYQGANDLLLLGRGDGHFEDATQASGIGAAATRSMGVVAFDVEADGDLDLYVACDGEANLLWINQGDGTFVDEALIRGVALNSAGAPEASMGIVCADPDGDGDEDLLVTHLERETNTYYRNDAGFFSDMTSAMGLSQWTRPDTTFGVGLQDLDHDKYLDLFVANGGVAWPSRLIDPENPYAQPDRVARGTPGGRFLAAMTVGSDGANGPDNTADTSRGAAFGDLDGDGLVDVVVMVRNKPARLLHNETRTNGNWIGFRLIAPAPHALIATVRVDQLPELGVRALRPHSSYLGSSEEVVRFGLGFYHTPVSVVVKWATGQQERFEGLATNQIHSLRQGAGGEATPFAAGTGPVTLDNQPARPSEPGELSTDLAATTAGSGAEAGPFPPLLIEKVGPRGQQAVLDPAALAAWCERAGLPPPPNLRDLDAPTWKLVHPAIEAAGRTPSPDTFGSLAMFYDGHNAGESARELYERLVKMQPEEARWWHLLGRVAFDLGDPERSRTAFEKAVSLAPDEPAGFARLADAQLATGQVDAALESWQQYLRLRPRNPYGLTGLAQTEERLGRLKEALESAEAVLARNPRARPALVLAARVAARLGKLEPAEEYGERAAALSKNDAPGLVDSVDLAMRAHARSLAYLRAAVNHFKEGGKYEEALEAARLLAERRPDEAQNWQMLTWLSMMLRRSDETAEYARTALEIDPNFAPGWELVAKSRLAGGELESALEAAEKAISIDSAHAPGYIVKGMVLGSLNRFEEGLASLKTGLAKIPDDIDGLAMKAFCQLNLGRREEALGTIDQILKLVPDHRWALKAREEL
ncbi:MAG: FG-GAP-like repeat-containing protein [Planctomycetota bacterium]